MNKGILDKRGNVTVRVVKVKGHFTDDMTSNGKVRQEDKDGNGIADEAADLGRRKQPEHIIIMDIRKEMQPICSYWYPLAKNLHECFIAVAGTVINNDGNGGT